MTDEDETVDEEEYRSTLSAAWVVAHVIERMPLGAMIRAAEHSDAITPIIDPTLWMRNGPALRQDVAMMRALAGVQKVMKEMKRGE